MVEALLERQVVHAWGGRAVADLTRGDLLKLLEDVRLPRQTEVATKGRGTFTAVRGGAARHRGVLGTRAEGLAGTYRRYNFLAE